MGWQDSFQSESAPQGDSAGMDALKSFGGGIYKGAAAIPMVLPDILNTAAAGPQMLGRAVASNVDKLLGIPEQPRGELWQPFYGSNDVLNALPKQLQPHEATTPAGMAADIGGQLVGAVVGGKAVDGVKSVTTANNNPAPKDLKTASAEKYQAMRDNGAALNQSGLDSVTKSIDDALKNDGILNAKRHGNTVSAIEDLKADAQAGKLDLEALDQHRQALNDVVSDNTSKLDGANTDARKAQIAIRAIDDAVSNLGAQHLSSGTPQAVESLNEARTLYAASARANTIKRIEDTALNTDNPATSMRTQYRNLAKQVNASPRGWSPEEIKAINHAAKTGIVTGALKTMGSRLISGVVGGTSGFAGGGLPGAFAGTAAGEAIAYPMREAATALQARRGKAVMDLVTNRPSVRDAMGLSTIGPQLPRLKPNIPVAAVAGAQEGRRPSEIKEFNPADFDFQEETAPAAAQPEASTSNYGQKLAMLESSGNATATNSSTSAKGAAQFTDSTWQHMVQKYGKANGLTRNGRNDPEQAAKAAELYAQENTPRLERALGRAPEAHELYLAHFLGAGGAAKILSSDPRASAAQVLPTAASKNRASFFDKSGKPYSVAQFYNNIQKKWENA